MKHFIPALLLSTTLALSAAAGAEQHKERGHNHHGAGHHFLLHERVADKLELSDIQREQIQSLVNNHREQYPHERDAYREQHQAIKALLNEPTFNEAEVRNILTEQSEKRLLNLRLQHELLQVLNTEQREQLEGMKKRMAKKGQKERKWHKDDADHKPAKQRKDRE